MDSQTMVVIGIAMASALIGLAVGFMACGV